MRLAQIRFLLPPFTPRGVAACAQAGFGRLFALQVLVAFFSGLVVLWLADRAWFPVLRQAIKALPDQGEISGGTLRRADTTPVTLAGGHFLALSVNVDRATSLGNPSHVKIEFGRTNVLVCSLLGCLPVNYPQRWRIAFNRPELEPWWGARESFIRFGLAGAVAGGVWLSWQVLSLIYSLPAWLAASLNNRELSLLGAWNLSGAALIPGTAVMLTTIGLYGVGALDLVRLGFGTAIHFLVGWAYLVGAVFFLPRAAGSARIRVDPFRKGSRKPGSNPFDPGEPGSR